MGGSEPEAVRQASVYRGGPGKVCQRLSGKERLYSRGSLAWGLRAPRRVRRCSRGGVPAYGKRDSGRRNSPACGGWSPRGEGAEA